ncbi:MAG: hypothetical protein Q9180_001901, partial [Flavoplaca navasiana]
DAEELPASHGGIVEASAAGDECGEDHDYPHRDDGPEVEHGSQHPGAMLVDLNSLDVVRATESSSGAHKCTDVGDEDENADNVAVDSVEEKEFVTDDGYKLPDHEETGREDGGKVDGDGDAVDAFAEPIPFTGYGATGIATFGGARDVQVGKTSEGEADDGSGEDDDWASQNLADNLRWVN